MPGRWLKQAGGAYFPADSKLQEYPMRRPGFVVPYLAAAALVATAAPLRGQLRVASPDGRTQVTVEIREGRLNYSLARDARALILPSLLGFEFRAAPPLRDGLRITDTIRLSHDEWWPRPGVRWPGSMTSRRPRGTASCWTSTSPCTTPASVAPTPT